MKILSQAEAMKLGYSADKRKRRRQHRNNAKRLIDGGTFLNSKAPRGSTPGLVARWHLAQARGIR